MKEQLQIKILLFYILLVVAQTSCFAADAFQCKTRENTALQLLKNRIKEEHLYEPWTTLSCLSIYVEDCDSESVDIVIREIHDEKCAGDPSVDPTPVVDRFRVLRDSERIEWYYTPEGEYVAFSKVHNIGRR